MDIPDPMEKASAQRFIGMSISDTISEEVGISVEQSTKIVDIVHGHTSHVERVRGKKKRVCVPRGLSSATIVHQIDRRSKYGKSFSAKWLSSYLMPHMERMGLVESFKAGRHVKTYRVNGYCHRS